MATVDGVEVVTQEVYAEGEHWRWRITTADGREYVDGGNYRSEDAARRGLEAAVDGGPGLRG